MQEDVRIKNIRDFLQEHVPEMLDFPEGDKEQFMLCLWNRFNVTQGAFQLYKRLETTHIYRYMQCPDTRVEIIYSE